MRYCKSCLMPDTQPNCRFNEEGICFVCTNYEADRKDDYSKRFIELNNLIKDILKDHKCNSRWNCIVGVSGGKDSTRQALWVREKLGLNPLLVSVTYPPRQISQVGVDNLSNLINLGFDTLLLGAAPLLSKHLVREAFLRFGNWCKATEMALFAGVPQVAIDKKIPLILWGENPATQVGETGCLGSSIWDGNNLVNTNTLAGGNLDWFVDVAKDERRLSMYKYPAAEELRKHKIHTVFLGPAWSDWGSEVNSKFSLIHGLNFRDDLPENTGDTLGTKMVDEDWVIVNYLLKFYKLGFSRGTADASLFIRSGLMTREEGIKHAELYDEACSDYYIESFCRYIELSTTEFWENVKKFANPKLFDLSSERPIKKFKVGCGIL